MANNSVADFSLFINQQINIQEQIETCLWKLEALMTVVLMAEGFYRLPENILHSYFLTAADLIEKAVKINQRSLNSVFKKEQLSEKVD